MTTINASPSSLDASEYSGWGEHDGSFPNLDSAQVILGSNIDPSKLKTLLGTKFGVRAYNMHVSV